MVHQKPLLTSGTTTQQQQHHNGHRPPLRSMSSRSFQRTHTVKRVFFIVWLMFASCMIVVIFQVQQTPKVLVGNPSTSTAGLGFLPEWSLQSASDYMIKILLAQEEQQSDLYNDDDDEVDDDNVYEEEADDDDDLGGLKKPTIATTTTEEGGAVVPEEDEMINTLMEIEKAILQIRSSIEQNARNNSGKLSPKLMIEYQKALRKKRAIGRNLKKQKKKFPSTSSATAAGSGNIATLNDMRQYYDKVGAQTTGGLKKPPLPAAYYKRSTKHYNRTATTKDHPEKLAKAKLEREQRVKRAKERREARRRFQQENSYWRPPHFNPPTTNFFEKKYPPLPLQTTTENNKRTLPDMSTGPGVIFFLHVPKTGGQTIRQLNPRFRRMLQRNANHKAFKQLKKMELQARRKQQAADRVFKAGKLEQQIEEEENNNDKAESDFVQVENSNFIPPPPPQELSPEAQEFEQLCNQRIRFVIANTLDVFLQTAVPQVNALFKQHAAAATKTNRTTSTGDSEKKEEEEESQTQSTTPADIRDKNKLLFVEVHGMDNFHALELEPYLHYWREQSQKTGLPFFAFTILREAISLQVSFFNFYYIHPGDPRFCKNPLKPMAKCGGAGGFAVTDTMKDMWNQEKERVLKLVGKQQPQMKTPQQRYREKMLMKGGRKKKISHENGMEDMTHDQLEKALIKVAYDNPQCLFLARGERTFGDYPNDMAEQRSGLTRKECQNMYMSLQRTMDWIGRTDTLTTETLPLLANIMFKRPELGPHLPKANVSPHGTGWVRVSKSSKATLKSLNKKSQLDQELYHRVKDDYTMDQWDRSSLVK